MHYPEQDFTIIYENIRPDCAYCIVIYVVIAFHSQSQHTQEGTLCKSIEVDSM